MKLPDNFFLGFDEFAPRCRTSAAPSLGQQLAQIEWSLNILIDAHVDAITALDRARAAGRKSGSKPDASAIEHGGRRSENRRPKMIEQSTVDFAFLAFAECGGAECSIKSPASSQQFYIIRTLHVETRKIKARRGRAARLGAAIAAPNAAGRRRNTAETRHLNFIVGNEHIRRSARIELFEVHLPVNWICAEN